MKLADALLLATSLGSMLSAGVAAECAGASQAMVSRQREVPVIVIN